MTFSHTVSDAYAEKCCRRWEQLCDTRFRNDLEVAELARDIRKVFPNGAAGDQMFMAFIKQNLKGCRKDIMLLKAESFATFVEADWPRFGGWQGIGFLLKLSKQERKSVIALMPGAGPYHYATIKKNARSLGIDPGRSGIGRPTREASEHNNLVLRAWMARLYKMDLGLPPMPNEVRAALTRTQRSSPSLGARA